MTGGIIKVQSLNRSASMIEDTHLRTVIHAYHSTFDNIIIDKVVRVLLSFFFYFTTDKRLEM